MRKKKDVFLLSLHIDVKLKERLDEIKRNEGRSLRWLVEQAIREFLERKNDVSK